MWHLMRALIATAFFGSALAFAPGAYAPTSTNTLTITAADQDGHDRVTLTFTGSAFPMTINADSSPPYLIGAGKERPLLGCTYYIHADRYPVPTPLDRINNQAGTTALPVARAVLAQYFEGELAIDVGLARHASYQVTLAGRSLYIDVFR